MSPAWRLLLATWESAARLALARYRRTLKHGVEVNATTLRRILARNADTEIGRRFGFAALVRSDNVEAAYRTAVPLADYAVFRDDIQRIASGAEDVLFKGRPRLFVSTSGTTGDPKLFPQTLRQQNEALRFMALLTPAARAECVPGLGFRRRAATLMVASRAGRKTAAGIPVGNPSGGGIRRILALAPPFWAFPPAVLTVEDYPTALYLHAYYALRARDLGCIEAIYSSHVVNWLGLILSRREDLIRDIARGALASDLRLTDTERERLAGTLAPDPVRAAEVADALAAGADGLAERLWPDLKVISCVISGAFAVSAPRLRSMAGPGPAFYTTCFGATEGMAGINLWRDSPERYALALGAGHFEFLPEREIDATSPATVSIADVRVGGRYELVTTTHAGLYRYRFGDVVRIAAFEGQTPVFEFDHRLGNVLDLVGEKTTEEHFRRAFEQLSTELPGGRASLVDFTIWPDIDSVPYRYVAHVEFAAGAPVPDLALLARRLDALLVVQNPSYATLARNNGRLAPIEIRAVGTGGFEVLLTELRRRAADASANQVKVPKLLRNPELRALVERSTPA